MYRHDYGSLRRRMIRELAYRHWYLCYIFNQRHFLLSICVHVFLWINFQGSSVLDLWLDSFQRAFCYVSVPSRPPGVGWCNKIYVLPIQCGVVLEIFFFFFDSMIQGGIVFSKLRVIAVVCSHGTPWLVLSFWHLIWSACSWFWNGLILFPFSFFFHPWRTRWLECIRRPNIDLGMCWFVYSCCAKRVPVQPLEQRPSMFICILLFVCFCLFLASWRLSEFCCISLKTVSRYART